MAKRNSVECVLQPSHLFSPNNLIAFQEIKSDNTPSELVTLNIPRNGTVQELIRNYSNFIKLPICILTVTPSAKSENNMKLFTYWLIEYLENDLKYPPKIAGPEILTTEADSRPGIYLWPKPYRLRLGSKEARDEVTRTDYIFVLIVYTNGKLSRTLESFLEMVVSESINILVDEQINYSSLTEDSIAGMYNSFYEQLGKINNIPAKMPKPRNGITVTLETLQTYLQLIVNAYNNILLLSKQKRNERERPPRNGQQHNGQQHNGQRFEQNAKFTSNERHQYTVDILQSVDAELPTWIHDNLTKENISVMMQTLQDHLNFSPQDCISKELQELVQIIQVYTSELHNMFDNYVCFAGEHDKKQMARFFTTSKARAGKVLEGKNHVYNQFTSSLLEECCEKITLIFEEDNEEILKKEKTLIQMVYTRVLDGYLNKIKTFSSADPNKMKDYHKKVSKTCTAMLTRSLDHSAKLNHVMSQYLRKLNDDMEAHFEKLLLHLSKRHYVNRCVAMYAYELEQIREQFSVWTRQERMQYHEYTLAKITELKHKSLLKEVHIRSSSYFLHFNEACEQTLESKTVDHNPTSSALCIYLTSEMVRIFVRATAGDIVLQTGTNRQSYLPFTMAMTDENNLMFGWHAEQEIEARPGSIQHKGNVMQCGLLKTEENTKIYERILLYFFLYLKQQAQLGFKPTSPYSKVLFAVPYWFDHENRGRIRDACHKAGFCRTFIVSEASLAAYLLLATSASQLESKDKDAVVVSVGGDYIDVRIYSRDLVSEASSNNTLVKMVAISKAGSKSLKKINEGKEDVKNIICKVYQDALAQLENGSIGRGKVCAVICELKEYLLPLKTFFQQRDEISSVRDLREDSGIANTLLHFSRKPEDIASVLWDYCVGSMSPQSSAENHAEMEDDDSCDAGYIERKRGELLQKCAIIRQQIQNGLVRLGVLSKKIVGKVLVSVEATLANENVRMDEIKEQEHELADLVNQYKFQF